MDIMLSNIYTTPQFHVTSQPQLFPTRNLSCFSNLFFATGDSNGGTKGGEADQTSKFHFKAGMLRKTFDRDDSPCTWRIQKEVEGTGQ